MLQEAPTVVWIAALLLFAGLLAFIVYRIRAIGMERHGLAFFFSLPFGLLFLTSTAAYAGALFPLFMGLENPGDRAVINAQWGTAIFLGSVVLAYLLNAVRSNWSFAVLYTIPQAAVASFSALILALWFLNQNGKKKNN